MPRSVIDTSSIRYRHPSFHDGLGIYQLVDDCPPLDINSTYYYYILCRDFSKTCVVAECNNRIVGFISSYVRPDDAKCLFVWQVAVLGDIRNKRVASKMLRWLIERPACRQIDFLETTISPSNLPSRRLFRSFAQEHGVIHEAPFLDASAFPGQGHEAELLFRISLMKRKAEQA